MGRPCVLESKSGRCEIERCLKVRMRSILLLLICGGLSAQTAPVPTDSATPAPTVVTVTARSTPLTETAASVRGDFNICILPERLIAKPTNKISIQNEIAS